ncbi:hypothetical protein ACUNV4_17030 [Granulosicoccus sp. 3-233]|uniref:hypothetical protein n=1 Tax=Granulosicoccus sp. 3-233 TaxID=3417969 RepID=UPI003D32C0C4
MSNSLMTISLQARWQVRHVLWLLLLSLQLLGLPDTSIAAIYTCPAADGSTIFQDRPCPQKASAGTDSRAVRKLPFDIHPSWFELPEQAEERAFCDRRRCECGLHEREHGSALARAVADALYMDGGWHRYQVSYQLWRNEPAASARNPQLNAAMQEAACSVMMSQQLLRDFSDEVSEELRHRVRSAEERGFDEAGPCEADVEQACDYLDSVELYQRLLLDARALQSPRELITSNERLPVDE